MVFQLTQAMDVGTANPIVARFLGLLEIIEITTLTEEKKEELKKHCFETMRFLIQAEKAALPLIEEIKGIDAKIMAEGIKTQSNGQVIETPGVLLLDNSRDFLKKSKQALQNLAKGMGVLLDEKFDGPHFHKVLKKAKERFGENHVVTKLLEEDQGWLKVLNDLRNEDEHPKSGKPFARGYNITKQADGKILVDGPRFFNDKPVLSFLEVYGHNLLTFSEELIIHTLEPLLPNAFSILEIPEDQRDPSKPVRYRLGLVAGIELPGKDEIK